jgi:hypothetical protein
VSFRRSSVSASLFRSSQMLCMCVKQVSYICVASLVTFFSLAVPFLVTFPDACSVNLQCVLVYCDTVS